MILKENFCFFNYFRVYNLKIYILFKLFSKIHAAIFTLSDNYGIITLSKVWTPFDRIKKKQKIAIFAMLQGLVNTGVKFNTRKFFKRR